MLKKVLNLKTFVTFRHWSRKSYATFSSIRKVIRIATLMILYLRFANPTIANEQTDTLKIEKVTNIDQIDVKADALSDAYSEISRSVVVIDRKEIEQSPVKSINELLEYALGVDIRQRGVNGVQADVSIRGGTFDQCLILLNGVNISDPQTGHHNLNLPNDLSSIERIEILKGSESWKYGPGAFSGAINIVTIIPDNSFISTDLSLGQHNTYKGNFNAGYKFRSISNLISANRTQSEGYTNNTDFKTQNLFYSLNAESKLLNLNFQSGLTDKKFGSNSFYTPKYPDQFEHTNTLYFSLGLKTKNSKNSVIKHNIYWRRNNDCFQLFRDTFPTWYKNHNYHSSTVYGGNVNSTFVHGANSTTSLGVDFRSERINSNVLGEPLPTPIESNFFEGISFNYSHSRENYFGYISHKHYISNLIINVGLNISANSDLDYNLNYLPGIDLNYSISKNRSIKLSINKTMRMPTFTDLYYKGKTNIGNADLVPEKAIEYEMSYSFNKSFIKSNISIFYRTGIDMIDWVRKAGEEVWKTQNLTNLNTSGFEFSTTIDMKKAIKSQKIIDRISFQYAFLNQDKKSDDYISYYLLDYLKNRVQIDFKHVIYKNLKANWHFDFQDRNGTYSLFENGAYGKEVDYKPFSIIDLKLYWEKNGWKIYTSTSNLFNKNYVDIANVMQPGRWFSIGFSKKFSIN